MELLWERLTGNLTMQLGPQPTFAVHIGGRA